MLHLNAAQINTIKFTLVMDVRASRTTRVLLIGHSGKVSQTRSLAVEETVLGENWIVFFVGGIG